MLLRVIPRTDDVRLRFVFAQVLSSPVPEPPNVYFSRNKPFLAMKIVHNIFVEITGLANPNEAIEILIANRALFRPFLVPGFEQNPSGRILTAVGAGPGGVFPTDFQLTRTSRETVRNPTLQNRAVIRQRTVGQVEGVTVSNTIANIDFAIAGSDEHRRDEQGKSKHLTSIRQTP